MTLANSNSEHTIARRSNLTLVALAGVRVTIADAIRHGDMDSVWHALQIANVAIDLAPNFKTKDAAIEYLAQVIAEWFPKCADRHVEDLDTFVADTFDSITEAKLQERVAELS